MKRGRPLKRTRLSPVSEKRAGRAQQRRDVVEAVLRRDRYLCQAERFVPDVTCSGPLDAHEVIPRSAWPDGYLVLDNIKTVCRAHHRWIDNHPDEAEALGLHGRSWQR